MDELFDILTLLNPWWKTNRVSTDLAKQFKRDTFKTINDKKKYRQITIISGLRRVGKTTLLYQEIESLLINTDSKKIFYFTFDKKTESIIKILESYSQITEVDYKQEKITVFFDEITKQKGWADELKIIYDSLPNIKFYLSSSSSINLEEEAIKSLAGRYFLINTEPLSFKEYLELREKTELIKNEKLYSKEIKNEFKKYLLRSFPETINWDDPLVIKDYLKTTIIDKIIKSDLDEKFKNINKELLFTLINLFYKEPGSIMDYDHLSKDLKISKKTLFKHVFYLETCYLIRKIKNYRPNTYSQTRKLQRIYPYWWTLAYCYTDNEDKIMENFVASTLNIKNYWRDANKEIDFLETQDNIIIPIEVKNKEKIDAKDLKNMQYFIEKYKTKKATIAYKGEEQKINNIITLKPFYKIALEKQ